MASPYKSRFSSSSRLSSMPRQIPESSNSGFWILIILFVILIIAAIMTGTIYKKYEKFTNAEKSYTLQYYCMERCGYCKEFESKVWDNYSEKINNNPLYYYFDTRPVFLPKPRAWGHLSIFFLKRGRECKE